MITNNYKKFLKSFLANTVVSNRIGNLDTYITTTNTELRMIDQVTTLSGFASFFNTLRKPKDGAGGIGIGFGTTPATEDDIDLDNPYILSTSQAVIDSVLFTYFYLNCYKDGKNYCIEDNFTLTNIGDSDITINEMGLFYKIGNTTQNSVIMIDRTVLDEPILLPAGGEVIPVKYTIVSDWDI